MATKRNKMFQPIICPQSFGTFQ